MNLDRIYDSNFYSSTTEGSLQAARRVLGTLWTKRQFASVVDVGCGTGAWLLAARELGAKWLQGIEGAHIPDHQFVVPYQSIVRADLDQPLESTGRFDLCLCLEVAEHLPKSRGESLVDDLAKLSPVVVFSAATPFQGGNGHVNEMWPEYWAKLFAGHGYLPWTGPREALWTDRSVPWWYRQNLLVFVHEAEWNALLPGETPASPNLLTAIHPENYLWCIRRERGELATSFDFDLDLYYASVQGKGVPYGYGPEFSVQVSEPLEESFSSGVEDSAPLVSVIIPCYRQAHYLPQAVRSVLDQTLQRVEVIVVDDGSPDDPRGQLGELADDPRVKYIRQENAGVGQARNTGVKASRGRYLNFLDADDWLAPEFCERMLRTLEAKQELGFVYCDLQHAMEDGADGVDEAYSVGASRRLLNGNILPSLLLGGYFPPHTVLVRRSVLNEVGLFDTELGGHADWDLWSRISASGYAAQYVDERLVYYRIHAASMSRDEEHMWNTRIGALRKLSTKFPGKVAEGIYEVCRSAAEQYAANQFLHDQILAFAQNSSGEANAGGALHSALLAAHVAREELRRERALWRSEESKLRSAQERFDQYFSQTQAWIATLGDAKYWHEKQASYWKSEAERLLQRNRDLNRRMLPRAIAWVRNLAGIEPRKS